MKEKNRPRTNKHEDEEDNEDFIIDTVGDRNLLDAIVENDDYVGFEEMDSSDEDVQMQVGPDRGLIEIQYPQVS